jgi:hypothetical protein
VKINLVDIIPLKYSNETNFDAEPSITVNHRDPNKIVITSFTPDIKEEEDDMRLDEDKAPIFYSTDSGSTWDTCSVLPNGHPDDISVRFGHTSGVLYIAIINETTFDGSLNVLRTADFTAPDAIELLINVPPEGFGLDKEIVDQPWLETTTANGKDIVFLSGNDTRRSNQNGQTAFIMVFSDAANMPRPADFNTCKYIEERKNPTQNLPSVRTAPHSSGIIYGGFFGWRGAEQGNNKIDVVVVRDDNWGTNSFHNLIDSSDGKPGLLVVKNVTVAPVGSKLGTQRMGSNLSMAVDPLDPRRVYIFWGDGANNPQSSPYILHVRRSDDFGQSWTSNDVFSICNALNPCIAVNSDGVVGLLYQELVNRDGKNRWRTHFVHSKDHLNTVSDDAILADVFDVDVPNPGRERPLSIGDYCNLISIEKDFYGVFSAYNEPDLANFPKGVTYLRNHKFSTKELLDLTNSKSVKPSVDPLFLHCQAD